MSLLFVTGSVTPAKLDWPAASRLAIRTQPVGSIVPRLTACPSGLARAISRLTHPAMSIAALASPCQVSPCQAQPRLLILAGSCPALPCPAMPRLLRLALPCQPLPVPLLILAGSALPCHAFACRVSRSLRSDFSVQYCLKPLDSRHCMLHVSLKAKDLG